MCKETKKKKKKHRRGKKSKSDYDKGLDSILYYDSKKDGIEIIWINVCFCQLISKKNFKNKCFFFLENILNQ